MKIQKIDVFLELYKEASIKRFIEPNVISLGNLALFVDYYFEKDNWNKLNFTLKKFLKDNNKNNFNIVIAKGIQHISDVCEIGDCISFKMTRMIKDYENNKLNDFDLILDEYDFPNWYKDVMDYFENKEFNYIKKNISKKLETVISDKIINERTINYFINHLINENKVFEYSCLIYSYIDSSDINQLCYAISKFLADRYIKDLNIALKHKPKEKELIVKYKELVNNTFGFYRNLYNNNRLGYIKFFTEEQQNTFDKLISIE